MPEEAKVRVESGSPAEIAGAPFLVPLLVITLVITAVGSALPFYRLDQHGFWLDEAFCISTVPFI